MSPLARKLLRDLKAGWKSFAAIWIICTLAMTLYVGIDATWRAMEHNLDIQFQQSNMADLWVHGAVSDRTVRDLEAIDGVALAQRRVRANPEAQTLTGEPVVALYMADGDPEICKPLILTGEPLDPDRKDQVILQEKFAREQGIRVGDVLPLKLGDRALSLTVCALGYLPEYVVTSSGDEFSPPTTRFGYGYVSPGTLSFLPFAEVVLTLTPGADVAAVKQAAQALFEEKRVTVLEREDLFGVKMAMEEAQQIRAMGQIFPAVFFIIAALITWTTMSRLVENQRLQIGTLFAIGYSRGELIRHYASYGLLMAVLGAVGGLAGAVFFFSPVILDLLSRSMYSLPGVRPYLAPLVVLGTSAIIALITGGASLLSAIAALIQSPAALMRPKPPAKGRRVVLENIAFIWKRLKFSSKMIMRNLARNPVRLAMGLIGVAGCTAMMLTGFGMKDSVQYVLSNHYDRTMFYDMRVSMVDDAPVDYALGMASRAGATEYEEEMYASCEGLMHDKWETKQIFVLEDNHDMVRLTDLTGTRLQLPLSGVAMTRKAAEEFGLAEGDTLWLRLTGERPVGATVMQVLDVQLDLGVYMPRSALRPRGLMPWRPNSVMLRGEHLHRETLEAMDGVTRVRTLEEEKKGNGAVLDVMNLVVLLLVVFSGALALVVLYNLGQLNFSERIRELATLMVLGFTTREIKHLVLRENIIIALIGLPIGLLLGPGLHRWVLATGLPNTIQFLPYIARMSWVYTAFFTVAFAVIVNWMLGVKFKDVNMVEALKSIE